MIQFPRNLRSLQGRPLGSGVVVSYVGQTRLPYPHVFVDSGKAYDLRPLKGLLTMVTVRPGVNCAHVCKALLDIMAIDYPTWIDVEEQHVAAVVDGPKPLGFKLWQVVRGSPQWRMFFA